MSKKDEVKSNLKMLRMLILAFLTALFSVCSYAFIERKILSIGEVGFILLVIVALFCSVCFLGTLYNKERKKLRKIK